MRDTAYNLTGATKPNVVFEESYLKGTIYIHCSYNGGVTWHSVYGLNRSGQELGFKQRIVSLATCANKPQVHVRFRVYQYQTQGNVWRLRNIVVTKQ